MRNEFQSRIDDKLNLMPRLGFTWAPFGSQRSAVRGGYGLFYDWYDSGLYDQTLRVDGVTVQDIRITCSALNNYCEDAGLSFDPLAPGVSTTRSGRIQASPDLVMPRVHQASISYDRQLTPSVVLQTSYQMLRGRHTMRSRNINAPVNGVRPNPEFGDITQFESTGRTQSDRLQFEHHVPNHPAAAADALRFNYTLGHEKNFAEQRHVAAHRQPESGRGLGAGEQRHPPSVPGTGPDAAVIRRPRATSTFTLRSGDPYNMTTGFDDNNDGAFNDRPAGVTRNSLRGDWTWGLNMNLNKRINIGGLRTPATPGRAQGAGVNFAQQGGGGFGGAGGGGQGGQGGFGRQGGQGNQGNNNSRFSMEISLQAQNLLNHVTHTGYTGNLSSRFFGTATSVGAARDVNLTVRFNF